MRPVISDCAICSSSKVSLVRKGFGVYFCACTDCGLRGPWEKEEEDDQGAGINEWNKLCQYIRRGVKAEN
jgi:transcription elongation factor Elf1